MGSSCRSRLSEENDSPLLVHRIIAKVKQMVDLPAPPGPTRAAAGQNSQHEHKSVTIVYLDIFQNYHLLKQNYMKKISTLTIIAIGFIALYSNALSAQTSQATGLNQLELMKQFIGKWENKANKDTMYTQRNLIPTETEGLEFTLKSVTQGKVWLEMKQLWGYDKKSDKIIIAGFMKDSPNFMLSAAWFTR
jgi:hypothetical protein